MTPREICLNGCAEIAANFTDFKPTQKGQKLTKLASDKEIFYLKFILAPACAITQAA